MCIRDSSITRPSLGIGGRKFIIIIMKVLPAKNKIHHCTNYNKFNNLFTSKKDGDHLRSYKLYRGGSYQEI